MRTVLPAFLLVSLACTKAPAPEPEPEPVVVDVSHARELRGLWVATVANIDFPSRPGLPVEAQRAELRSLVNDAEEHGFNAIFFQVRPEGDALYASELEPWSRFLTGTQGEDPGYDPLAELIALARPRGIEVHAWLNPYRASSDRARPNAAGHLATTHPERVVRYGALLWMDPGQAAVRAHTTAVVTDLVRRYDIDGVHFDDYFYPYPNGTPFPDAASYAAYQAEGGELALAEWRVANVNQLVEDVHGAVNATKPEVDFGISPFGIYRPGEPEGIRGMDQVEGIHADPLHWMREGHVDYLAPQLYWPTTQSAQAFEPLLGWWAEQAAPHDGTRLYVGHYLSQVTQTPAWTTDELRTQRSLAQAHPEVAGSLWFSTKPLREDRGGVRTLFRELHAAPALPPARGGEPPAEPTVELDEGALCMQHEAPDSVRQYVVYGPDGAVHALVPGDAEAHLEVPPGRYTVSAASPTAVESRGVVVEVTSDSAGSTPAPGSPPAPGR